MRYSDLFDAKAWRRYSGRDRRCPTDGGNVLVQYGRVTTGRQRVHAGFFVQVVGPDEQERLFEDPHSLSRALRAAGSALERLGVTLEVIGLSAEWRESPMSWNSGYGYHPRARGPVHMLDSFDDMRDEKRPIA